MKCGFEVQYYCDGCCGQHSTYVQYSREVADPPDLWDTYDDGRQDSEVKNLIGRTFVCNQSPLHRTKIQTVDKLIVWRVS